MNEIGFDYRFLLSSLPYSLIGLGVAIALLVVALKGIQKTGADGWKFLLAAQIVSLSIITIRIVPMLMMAAGNYAAYDIFGTALNILGIIADLAVGILMVVSLVQILQVAVPKTPPQPPYPNNW